MFKQFYKINFGYTQVLFMGSVPRINCLLTIVPLPQLYLNKGVKRGNQYDKLNKGVSILFLFQYYFTRPTTLYAKIRSIISNN